MVDNRDSDSGYANLRGLVEDLSAVFDAKMVAYRSSTPHPEARPSEIKTFGLIARRPRTEAELARTQKISRQAAFKSVRSLVAMGLAKAEYQPGNRRDKLITLTPHGEEVRTAALAHIKALEDGIAARIGRDRLEHFRETLLMILGRKTEMDD